MNAGAAMRDRRWKRWTVVAVALFTGCASWPDPVVIYDTPRMTVSIQYDPRAGRGHSHPASVGPEEIARVLQNVTVKKRDPLGLGGLLSGAQPGPAFSPADVAALTPYLVEALRKASPKDLAAFYITTGDPSLGTLVTSGGLFVRHHCIYVVLANFRTPPSAGPFEGTAYELDSKNDPLFPIARYRFTVGFNPEDAAVLRSQRKECDDYDYVDDAKLVVVDLRNLGQEPAGASSRTVPAPLGSRP